MMATRPLHVPRSGHSLVAAARAAFFGYMALVVAGLFSADSDNVLVAVVLLGLLFVTCCFAVCYARSRRLDRLAHELPPTDPRQPFSHREGRAQ